MSDSTPATASRLPQAGPRLRPPSRGDGLGVVLLLIGFAVYVAALLWIFATGLVSLRGVGAMLATLNVISIALTLFAFGWSLLYDLRRLRDEEEDIQFLLDEGPRDPNALHRVLWPREGGVRREPGETKVDTLLDDLAVQVQQLEPGRGGHVPTPSELRAVAVSRTAWLGSCARYVSQLLLLMTVLGTFVGVKEALPDLVDSLRTRAPGAAADSTATPTVDSAAAPAPAAVAGPSTGAAQPRQGFDEARLRDALRKISDAFGSNLGALLGSIALGLVAFGLGVGRQSLLARLEHVSILYVYPRLASASDESTLARAVARLGDASGSLERIAEISGVLEDLKASLERMSDETREALAGVLQEQKQQVLSDTQQTVDRLQQQITDVVVAVQHSAVLYDGMAAVMGERSDVLANALAEVRGSAAELHAASVDYGGYVRESTQAVRTQLTALETTFVTVRESVDGAASASGAIRQELSAARDGVGVLIERADAVARALAEAEARRRTETAELERRQRELEAELLLRQREADTELERREREALDRIEASLVERVAERLSAPITALEHSVSTLPEQARAGVLHAFRDARAQRIGGGADDLSASLERVAGLIERLDRPADQLVRALQGLTTRIDRLEERTRPNLFGRMMDRLRGREVDGNPRWSPAGPSTSARNLDWGEPAEGPFAAPPRTRRPWSGDDDASPGRPSMATHAPGFGPSPMRAFGDQGEPARAEEASRPVDGWRAERDFDGVRWVDLSRPMAGDVPSGETPPYPADLGFPPAGEAPDGELFAGEPTAELRPASERAAPSADEPFADPWAADGQSTTEAPSGEPAAGNLPGGESSADAPAGDEPSSREPAVDDLPGGGAPADEPAADPAFGEPAAADSSGGESHTGEASAGEPSSPEPAAGGLSEDESSSPEPAAGGLSEDESSAGEPSTAAVDEDEPPTGDPAPDEPTAGTPSGAAADTSVADSPSTGGAAPEIAAAGPAEAPGARATDPAEAADARTRRLPAELTQDGRFERYPEEVSRPMAEVRWIPGERDAEAYILRDFVFGLDSRRLELAFDVDQAASGRYETVQPARITWDAERGHGTVVARGRLRLVDG